MANDLKKYMNQFDELLGQLETKIPVYETTNPKISQASVGWHIEHTLLVFNEYVDFLTKSNPKDYKWKFNFIRVIVLVTKLIPRGFGKSPKVLLPKEHIDKDSLVRHLSATRNNIKQLELLSQDKFVEHPVFGQLKLGQTVNFLDTHTRHHLKIIEDIIK